MDRDEAQYAGVGPDDPRDTEPDEIQEFVERIGDIAYGKANARTARTLRATYGYSDRQLRALVHAANEAGYLIVADNGGYFIPAGEEEVSEAVGRLNAQALEMLARARQIKELAFLRFSMPTKTGTLF